METTILGEIRKLIGIEDDTQFDDEIIPLINSEFSTIAMIGIGPSDGFSIESGNETWSDFCSNGVAVRLCKEYIALKVGIVFDPPQNSFVNDTKLKRIAELEWRLRILGEPEVQDE